MALANQVLLSLGSNLGNKIEQLHQAIRYLHNETGNVTNVSSAYKTAPWGKASTNSYMNQAVILETTLTPSKLLQSIQEIENRLGRIRTEKWGDRTLDIDIVFYDQSTISVPELSIPHSELANRRFVLLPANEIAPNWKHPIWGKTISELLNECSDTTAVNKY
jgi:2-amino-4-hydroxy-6-hydroxymethyldihydropteridine diphosphokinase